MNDHLNPVFQTVLRGVIPAGFRSAPVMHATEHWEQQNKSLRAALASFDAPPCPAGQFAHTYQLPDVGELECHLEGEEGDESVGWPAQVTLCEAYLRGARFTDRLRPDEVEAIETAALKQPREQEPA
jgi:hypothetical protein